MQNNAPTITKTVAEDLALGKNGSYGNDGNVLQDSLWDQIVFAGTAPPATQTFFSVPQGAAKGLTETNLTDPSKLPNGQTFLIKAMCIGLIANVDGAAVNGQEVLAAYYNIMQNSVFEIKIAGREFDMRKPGSEWLAPVAIASQDAASNNSQASFLANGKVKLNATPIPLGQMVTFQVIQRTETRDATVQAQIDADQVVLAALHAQLHIRLEGILTRAI